VLGVIMVAEIRDCRKSDDTEGHAMKNFTLIVTVEPQEEGGYLAICENIKQCYAEGETYEEAVENLKDVARICLELDAQREGTSLEEFLLRGEERKRYRVEMPLAVAV
jgi:predicted RNase H-like HicB family nuclease